MYDEINRREETPVELKSSGFFLTPAVRVSIRTTNNSYLEARLGYDISGKLPDQDGEYANRNGSKYTVHYDAVKMSGLFFGIGWTHTFKLGSR